MAKNRKNRLASESIGFLAVVGAILVVLNVVAGSFGLGRFDLTHNDTYSLSEGSRRLARSLDDQMVIKAYFSDNLPPPFNSTERYVRDLLAEYEAASNGNIAVRFVHPSTDEEREAAEQDGVHLVGQRVYANDSVSVVEGYRGLAIDYLGESKAIPVIAGTGGLEYQITMLMKQMVGEKVKVGIVGGHEGPSLDEELAALKRVMPNYELVDVNLGAAIPEDVKALLVIAPETAIPEAELRKLDAFVMGGGSLGIFGGGVKLDQSGPTLSAAPVDSGLNRLLERWGVTINGDVVGDARCQVIGVRGPLGVMPRPYPPLAIAQFTDEQAENPATYHLTEARMPFASTLTLGELPEGVSRTVLATSSEQSWRMTGDRIDLDQNQRWQVSGEIGPFPLMVSLEGKLPSAFAAASGQSSGEGAQAGPSQAEKDVRVLVLGSGAAPIIQLPQGQEVSDEELAGALALPLNAIDWLANDDDLIAVRAKTVDEPSLDIPQAVQQAMDEESEAVENRDVEGVMAAREQASTALDAWEAKKDGYRWANMLGIPVFFAGFGLIRWRLRQRKKAALSA
jgi:ABC-type uncharacterized transport system involved in gliding motility auxiliary subunit